MQNTYAVSSVDCGRQGKEGSNQADCNEVDPLWKSLNARQSAHLIGERSAVRIGHRVPKFRFKWAEELKCSIGVYVRRWYVETPIGSVRVHHWLHSDDNRAFHDHPWWFWTFVLKGGYRDVSASGEEAMKAPKMAFRPALHAHTVQVDKGGCWTILITGSQFRKWGFWVGKKWKKSNKYFLEHGMHVCD